MTAECDQIQRWHRLNQAAVSKIRRNVWTKEIVPGRLEDDATVAANIFIGQVFRDLCQVLEKSWSCEQMARWVQDCARARWVLDGVIVLNAKFIPRLTPLSRAAKDEGWTKQELSIVKREALAALKRLFDTKEVPADIYRKLPKLLNPKQKKRTHDYLRDAWIGWAVLTRVNTGMRVAQAIHEVADCAGICDDAVKKIWLRHKKLLYAPKGLLNKPLRKKGKQTPHHQVG